MHDHAGIVGIDAPPNNHTGIMVIGACLIAMMPVWLLYVRTVRADNHAGNEVIVRSYSRGLFLFAIPLFRYHRKAVGRGPHKAQVFITQPAWASVTL